MPTLCAIWKTLSEERMTPSERSTSRDPRRQRFAVSVGFLFCLQNLAKSGRFLYNECQILDETNGRLAAAYRPRTFWEGVAHGKDGWIDISGGVIDDGGSQVF